MKNLKGATHQNVILKERRQNPTTLLCDQHKLQKKQQRKTPFETHALYFVLNYTVTYLRLKIAA